MPESEIAKPLFHSSVGDGVGFNSRANLGEGDHLEDPGIDGMVPLNGSLTRGMGGMDWIDLAEDRDRWRALVNAVMNLRVP